MDACLCRSVNSCICRSGNGKMALEGQPLKVANTLKRALTGVGRSTLVTERESNLSISATILIVDDIIDAQQFAALCNKNMRQFDRFRSRVVGNHYFELIPDFDFGECITELIVDSQHTRNDLKPFASMQAFLEDYISMIANTPLPNSDTLPMWRMHLLQFVDTQKSVIVFRVHHCVCDGVTLGSVLTTLAEPFFSPASDNAVNEMSGAKHTKMSPVKKTRLEGIAENPNWNRGVIRQVLDSVAVSFVYFFAILAMVFKAINHGFHYEPLSTFKPVKLSTSKNIAFLITKLSMSKINTVRKIFGLRYSNRLKPTFNDFMLSIVAEGIYRYFKTNNLHIPKYLTVSIPVNMRGADEQMKVGNKIGCYVVRLPIGQCSNFTHRLFAIKSQMDHVKATPEPWITHYLLGLSAKLPPWIARPLSLKFCSANTLVFTNIRATDRDYGILGSLITHTIGLVPPPIGIGVGICVNSYRNGVTISANLDRNIGIDTENKNVARDLIKEIESVLTQLNCVE